jgi:hypothetical protein
MEQQVATMPLSVIHGIAPVPEGNERRQLTQLTLVQDAPQPRMSEEEFDRRFASFRATYGARSSETTARRDQAFAQLIAGTRWSLREISARTGLSTATLSRSLTFAGFLSRYEHTHPAVTCRKFYSYWQQTAHLEKPTSHKHATEREATPIRYAEVARLFERAATQPKAIRRVRLLHPDQIGAFLIPLIRQLLATRNLTSMQVASEVKIQLEEWGVAVTPG